MTTRIQHLETRTHGRYLYEERDSGRLLIGFHGYGESADAHLAELQRIPGVDSWSVVAVQALHPFYTRVGSVVASWMTSLDRELALADNIAYVRRVVDALPPAQTLVFAGFSQGASMAARAASAVRPCAGLILLGGDIPPDVQDDSSVVLPPVLLARGLRDEWYTEEKFKKDLSYLKGRTEVTECVFEGGHEWTEAVREAMGRFLAEMRG
jgi:predicted esterase